MNKNTNIIIISVILIALVLLSRLVVHTPNFTPVLSVLLLSTMIFDKKYLFIPFVGILCSDLLLHYSSASGYLLGPLFFSIYFTYLLIALSIFYFSKKVTVLNIALNSVFASTVFFILSNFAVWLFNGGAVYPYSILGLTSCYIAAIPFYYNTLLSTIVFSVVLFAPILSLRASQSNYSLSSK